MPEIPPKIVGDGPVQGTVMVDNGTGELLMVPIETAKNLGIAMPGQAQPPTTPPSSVNQPLDFTDILSQGVPGQAQPDTLLAQADSPQIGGIAESLFGSGSPSVPAALAPPASPEPMQALTPEGLADGVNRPSNLVHSRENVAPPGVLGRDTRRADAPLSDPVVLNAERIGAAPTNVIRLPEGIVNTTPEQQAQLEAQAESQGRTIADVAQQAVAEGTLRILQGGGGSVPKLQGDARRGALAELGALRSRANELGNKLGILAQEEQAFTREGGDIQEKGAIGAAEEIEGLIAQSELIEQQRLDDRERQEKEVAAEMAHLSSMMENLSTQRVDPNRLFAGTPARLSAAIGAGVGAALSAAERMTFGTDGGNVALGIINEAIERDVQAQIVNYNRASGEAAQQSSFIGLLRQRTGDIDAAADLARSVQTDIAVKELSAMRSRTRGAAQQNAIDLLINSMRGQSEAGKLQGIQAAMVAKVEELEARVSRGPGLRTLERAGKIVERSAEQLSGPDAGEGQDPSTILGGVFTFTGDAPRNINATINNNTMAGIAAADALGELARVQRLGRPNTLDEWTRFEAAYATALTTVVKAQNRGMATEGDVVRSAGSLGGRLTDAQTGEVSWTRTALALATWNQMGEIIEGQRDSLVHQLENDATHGTGSTATFVPRGLRRAMRHGIRDR